MIRITIVVALTAVCPISAISQDQWKNVYVESAWASRDQWQQPEILINRLGLQPGSAVADIGCHEGYMTFKLAAVVGPQGSVYSVDLDKVRLDKLKKHRDEKGLTNIIAILGDPDSPGLPEGKLDAVLILDSYHEIREYEKVLQHVKKALKPDGRLVICEPIADLRRKLPRSDQEAKHEVGMNFVAKDLENIGFRIISTKDPFVDRTKEKGDKMWLIVAVKSVL